jgi:Raf kinase inhibitor-like YbhB/YbcL family protein
MARTLRAADLAAAFLLLSAPAFASGLTNWPENQTRPTDEPPEQPAGRYAAPPCTGFFDDMVNGPEGGRLASTMTLEELTPFEGRLLPGPDALAALTVESPAFGPGGVLPSSNTAQGADLSPALTWSGVPPKAKSLALVVFDEDAPLDEQALTHAVHWLIYDLPADLKGLPEGVVPGPNGPGGSKQGRNDFDTLGWKGPQPPCGTHRYVFRLFALSEMLGLKPGATKNAVYAALEYKQLGRGELIGRFSASK